MESGIVAFKCLSCGGQLPIPSNSNVITCPFCKSQYLMRQELGSIRLEPFAVCPKCHQAQNVVRVRAMVQGQSGRIDNSESVNFQTDLARKLAAPEKPQLKEAPQIGGGCGLFMMGWVALGVAYFLLGFLVPNKVRTPVMFVLFALLVLIALSALLSYIRQRADYSQSVNRVKTETPKWEQAVQRWEELYYCRADDVVFFPGSDRFADANQMQPFLYSG